MEKEIETNIVLYASFFHIITTTDGKVFIIELKIP